MLDIMVHLRTSKRLPSSLLLSIFTIAGCGGGGSAEAPPSMDLFPLKAGSTWTYDSTDCNAVCTTGTISRLVTVTSVSGQAIYTITANSLVSERFGKSDTEVIEYPEATDALAVAAGPQVILRQPWKLGDQWTKEIVVAGNGGSLPTGTHTLKFHVTVHGIETVKTPLGDFDAVKVSSTWTRTHVSFSSPSVSQWATDARTDWYAPGIGRVKRYRQPTSSTSLRPRDTTDVLKAYQLQ